jgi:HTH-type transcriptional regulator, sugar sensing transcriptional regulator
MNISIFVLSIGTTIVSLKYSIALLQAMDTSILEDLGLTRAEISIYIALLELGSTSAGSILDKSKLQNSVVHRALNSLIEKGLVSYIMQGKHKVYQATDPENFDDFIDDKRKRFHQLLPELKQKQSFAQESNAATIYKGIRGINEVYTKILNSCGNEYLTYGGGKQVCYAVMGEHWWKNLHTKRISKKLPSRQVFDESIRTFGEQLRRRSKSQVRFLSQEFEQLTETVICGNYVAIVIFTEDPYALLIENEAVIESYKKNFEILWKKAKK